MTERSTRRDFRKLLAPGAAVVLPGVSNALAARVVADLGFAAAYVTGAGIANTFLGIPDNGLVTLTELADHVAAIRGVFAGPLMVDADTGFGNAVNMVRTVKLLERAGADAIQIEDQVFPKRCGHFDGKAVIPQAEMVAKIKAAVDARADADVLIVARTDAIATDGFAAAIERAHAYREAGADVGFVEAPQSLDEIAGIPRLLAWPQVINIVLGGRTPADGAAKRWTDGRCVPARGRFRRAPAAGRQAGIRCAGAEIQGGLTEAHVCARCRKRYPVVTRQKRSRW